MTSREVPPSRLNRRGFVGTGLAAGAGLVAGGGHFIGGALAAAERRNVVLIVIDSLRVPRSAALARLPPGPLRRESRINSIRQYLANNGRGRNEREQAAARVFTKAAELLPAARRHGRFLMVVDSFDPHEPWAPPRRYLDLYGDPHYHGSEIADVGYTHASNYLTRGQLARLRATYGACVTMTDRWLGAFLDRLWDLGLDDSTAVLLVSDHGALLGEHDWTGKGSSLLHPEMIHVPLLLREPGGSGAGATSDWFASTHDVAPTLTALAGARRPPTFEGGPFAPAERRHAGSGPRPCGWRLRQQLLRPRPALGLHGPQRRARGTPLRRGPRPPGAP